MALEFTTSAKRKFGDSAQVRGNGPFALASLCYSNRYVLLYASEADRNNTAERWSNAGCGAPGGDCAGDQLHRKATLTGFPESIKDAVEAVKPKIFYV